MESRSALGFDVRYDVWGLGIGLLAITAGCSQANIGNAPGGNDPPFGTAQPDAGSAGNVDQPDASTAVSPDAVVEPTPIGAPCDPIAQAGCDADQKCAWIVDDPFAQTGAAGCFPDGIVEVGDTCSKPTAVGEADDCVAGAFCAFGACRSMCAPGAGSCTGGQCTALTSAPLFDACLPDGTFTWFQTSSTDCSAVCGAQDLLNIASPEGATCASGENKPPSAVGLISYAFGCWPSCAVGIHPDPRSVGGNCYGTGQKRDNDSTDRTVGCFCGPEE